MLREFSADQILSTYVIDDVWEYMEAMKDWKHIILMLLDENRLVPAAENRKPHETKAQKVDIVVLTKLEHSHQMTWSYLPSCTLEILASCHALVFVDNKAGKSLISTLENKIFSNEFLVKDIVST